MLSLPGLVFFLYPQGIAFQVITSFRGFEGRSSDHYRLREPSDRLLIALPL